MKPRFTVMVVILSIMLFIGSCNEEIVETPKFITPPVEILRSDLDSSTALNGSLQIRDRLQEVGVEIGIATDWVKRGEAIPALNRQLVVGVTNRAETVAEYNRLKEARRNSQNDWSILELDGLIMILGVSDAALNEAIQYFIENYIGESGIKMPQGERYEYKYPFMELKITDTPITEFGLKSAESALLASAEEYLRTEIYEKSGYLLTADGSKKIAAALDTSIADNRYRITIGSGGVSIAGGTYDAVRGGIYRFAELLLKGEAQENRTISEVLGFHKPVVTAPPANGGYTSIGDPVWLIDDENVINSGWDHQFVSADYEKEIIYQTSFWQKLFLDNTAAREAVWMERPFVAQRSGVLTLETRLACAGGKGGRMIVRDSGTGKTAMLLELKSSDLYAGGKAIDLPSLNFALRVLIDLDNNTYTVFVNNTDCGTFGFVEKTDQVDLLRLELDLDAANKIVPQYFYLHKNLPIMERFRYNVLGDQPLGFDVSGNCALTKDADVRISAGGEAAGMEKSFQPFNGKAVFEILLLSEDFGSSRVALLSGGKTAISLGLEGIRFECQGETLRHAESNLWYLLRIEADTRNQTAEIKINGKSLGYFPFENPVTAFDGVRITAERGSFRVDDLYLYQQNEYNDYVPAPLSSGSNGYYVGMQVCSLWRNGYHYGWDAISPYDELKPVLAITMRAM